ncbi:unnamed protein product [Discula destructiva]
MVAAVGIYGSSILFAWASNNNAPAGRRAIISAWTISFGIFGGIFGSFIYLEREGPAYNSGFGLLPAMSFSALVGTFSVRYSFKKENETREKLNQDEVRSQYSDKELLRMGDRSPLFKHTL